MSPRFFKTREGQRLKLPIFFPDATKAVVRTVDSVDIQNTKTPGILVNTYHLYRELGSQVIKEHGSIGQLMNWPGAVISDSGGFQVMSIFKSGSIRGKISDIGITYYSPSGRKIFFTPEKSIQFQMKLKTDLLVVLDDFTPPKAQEKEARESVERTILWAKRCKEEFIRICESQKIAKENRPYLVAVAQGGRHIKLRKECTERLVEIGFDGMGLGGRPHTDEGDFEVEIARTISRFTPKNYLLYGLGVGHPKAVVTSIDLGYQIFDCVLPTRDGRHGRLYIFNSDSIDKIDIRKPEFFSYFSPQKEKYYHDTSPVSRACDCLLCTHYTRSYLAHLFRIKDATALRLSTIHNLRFYSLLMEKLRKALNT